MTGTQTTHTTLPTGSPTATADRLAVTVTERSRDVGLAAGVPRFLRAATGVALVLYAALAVVFALTLGTATSGMAFLGAHLFLVGGVVGLSRVTLGRAPVLTLVTVTLLLVASLGHGAASGVELIAAVSPDGPAATDALYASPWGLAVAGPTMIGLILGTVLLGVLVARSVPGAWWIALTLTAWVIVEFFASGLGLWSTITSGALLVASFAGLAVLVWRSDLSVWALPSE